MTRPWVSLVAIISGVLLLWQCGGREKRDEAASDTATTAAASDRPGPVSSVTGSAIYAPSRGERIFVVDFPVTLKGGTEPRTMKTDIAGRYRFTDVAPGRYTVCWETPGWTAGCTNEVEVRAGESAYPKAAALKPMRPDSVAWGSVRLADGSAPTLIDRATNKATVPSVEVVDASGKTVATGRTNADGQYAIGVTGAVARVRTAAGTTRGERALAQGAAGADRSIVLDNQRPIINGVTLRKGGADVTRVSPGDTVTLHPTVSDPDGDTPTYAWVAGAGEITTAADGSATWHLPPYPARLRAYLTVTDGNGGAARRTVSLSSGAANAKFSAPTGPPTTCTPLSLTAVPPPSGYPPTPVFLTYLNTETDNSTAYYNNVDPKSLRTTLGDWWKNAGFSATDGSGGVAQAAYLNWNDLGFGRDMHFNQVGNNVYAWVTNYGCPDNSAGNADLAASPVPADAVATVCMEYAPVEGSTTPIVKFFVYVGGVPAGVRTGTADLDEWGGKFVPNLCQVCHGGATPYSGGTNVNLGSSFIPFDLALLRYPKGATTPPATDLPAYYKMNSIILNNTNPSAAIAALIKGWYTPLNTPPTQNNAYVPAGWTGSSVPSTGAGLYANVVVPGCRTCHYSLSPSISWDTYSSFSGYQSVIQPYVCASGPVMPHAAVTYVNFWTNAYGFTTSPPQYLGAYSDANWTSFGGCTGK